MDSLTPGDLDEPFGLLKLCPVCGWPQAGFFSWCLGHAFQGFCECCGTEFGLEDAHRTLPPEVMHARLRQGWLAKGAPWALEGIRPGPAERNPDKQIERLLSHPGWLAEWYELEANGNLPIRDLVHEGEETAIVDLRGPDARIDFERVFGTGQLVHFRALVRRPETTVPSSARVESVVPVETSDAEELGPEQLAELDALAAVFRPRIDSEEWPLRGDISDALLLDRFLSSASAFRALTRFMPHDAYDIAGAYLGRLIIDATGGRWMAFKDDIRAELGAMVVRPSGATIWPFERIHKQRKGPVWSIASYVVGLGLMPPADGESIVA